MALKQASLVVVFAASVESEEIARVGNVFLFKTTHSNENVWTQKLHKTIHTSSKFIYIPKQKTVDYCKKKNIRVGNKALKQASLVVR